MGLKKFLLKLALKILQGVISEITKQVNVVENEITQEVQKYLNQVIDGAWKGPDAERFKQEVQGMVLPRLSNLTGICTKTVSGIDNAVQVVQQADQKVTQLVSDLNTTFSKIY
jgi:uncharacterized protein YukE